LIIIILINLLAGIVFGLWVRTDVPMDTLQWHVMQIVPLVSWYLSFYLFGWTMKTRLNSNHHNIFGYLGRYGAVIAACGIGYIIGLELSV
jgi:hypothetical protein